ncbi:MAG: c-type cytochrome [Rudaea sp.]
MSFRHVIAVAALLGAGSIQAAPAAPAPAKPTPAAATTAKPAAATAATAPAEAPPKPGDATAGQAKSGTCAACHGIDGNSASSQYPKLAGQHESYIARQIELIKTGKRPSPVMMGFAMNLSKQDMADIGAYFASKTSLPGVADAKLVAQGEALYRGGNKDEQVPACMACHGPDGRGNPGAMYPQLAGQHADYVALKLKDWRDGKTWGDDAHARIMALVAKGLSDSDIAAVSSYVEGLHAVEAGTMSTAAK